MSTQVKYRRESAAYLDASFTGVAGELAIDTTNNRVRVCDGSTLGGFPAARLDEVIGLSALSAVGKSLHGAETRIGVLEELISGLFGTPVLSTIEIPAGAYVYGISGRVITAVTGVTSWSLTVDGGGFGYFGSGGGLTVGSTLAAIGTPLSFAAATKAALQGQSPFVSFTGGAIRIAIHYIQIVAPTS